MELADYLNYPLFNSAQSITSWLNEKSNNNEQLRILMLGNILKGTIEERVTKRKKCSVEGTPDIKNRKYYITIFKNDKEINTKTYDLTKEDEIVNLIYRIQTAKFKPVKVEFKEKAVEIIWLDPSIILPSPEQKRKVFGAIEQLTESIRLNGQFDAVKVFVKDGQYYIKDGERRLRACKELKKLNPEFKIKVEIVEEGDNLADGLLANLQRDAYNPITLANAILDIIKQIKETNSFGAFKDILTQDKISYMKAKGLWQDTHGTCSEITTAIEKTLGLTAKQQKALLGNLKEHPDVQKLIAEGKLGSEDGEFVMRLNWKEFPPELQSKIKDVINREKVIKGVERKAKDARNFDAKYLSMFFFLESVPKRLDKGLVEIDLAFVSQATKDSVRNRAIKLIEYLQNKLSL